MRMLPNLLPVDATGCQWMLVASGPMPTVSPGGLSHGQTACEPASQGVRGRVIKYEVSWDWRFQPPPIPWRDFSQQKLAFMTNKHIMLY